tara:strand:+ start:1001 stop:1591 length:591 start_codon:yes stop_codon:yes gene_type:complete
MGGPVAEDSGRDNRRAIAQVQSRQRTAEANRLPGLMGGLMGGLGDMNRRNIIRGLELGGEAVRDERGQVVGVINLNKMGARVYSGRPGYDPNAPKPERRSDEQPSTASPAAAPSLPPANLPASSPVSGAPGSSGQAAPAADPIRPASVVRSAGETAAVTRGRASPYMRGRRTRSILTSSRGVLGDAPTEKKQLLGS